MRLPRSLREGFGEPFDRIDDRIRKVLGAAREVARAGHTFVIGPAILLAATACDTGGRAAHVLATFNARRLAAVCDGEVEPGEGEPSDPPYRFSAESVAALKSAVYRAAVDGRTQATTADLLAALLDADTASGRALAAAIQLDRAALAELMQEL